jgi:hypothetical protein
LNADADEVVNGFIHQSLDRQVRLINISETEILLKKQEGKLREIEEETKKINCLIQDSMALKKQAFSERLLLEGVMREHAICKERYTKIRKQLESIGFREELNSSNIKHLEKQCHLKKLELAAVEDDLSMFEGADPTVQSIRDLTDKLVKETDEVENALEKLLGRMSL